MDSGGADNRMLLRVEASLQPRRQLDAVCFCRAAYKRAQAASSVSFHRTSLSIIIIIIIITRNSAVATQQSQHRQLSSRNIDNSAVATSTTQQSQHRQLSSRNIVNSTVATSPTAAQRRQQYHQQPHQHYRQHYHQQPSPPNPTMRASIAFVSALLSAIASAAPVPVPLLNVGVGANVNLDLNLGGNSYRCVYFPAPAYKRSAEPLLGLNLGLGLDV
ncbi:hypothetical protein GQ42DRAFT_163321, partial [Ramicandelaber brevisporus]